MSDYYILIFAFVLVLCAGLVRHVSYLFLETSQTCLTAGYSTSDLKATTTVLAMLLDTINGALRYVSEIVRRALEVLKCYVLF